MVYTCCLHDTLPVGSWLLLHTVLLPKSRVLSKQPVPADSCGLSVQQVVQWAFLLGVAFFFGYRISRFPLGWNKVICMLWSEGNISKEMDFRNIQILYFFSEEIS